MESKYDYVVFDIETTGLHPDSDQICEIAAIGVKDGLPQGTFSTLVAIEGSMPEAAGRVNGITDAANPTAKAGSYNLAPTGAAGATLTLKAQGDAKNVKEDIAKDKTVATITWTFAAGNAAE